MLILARELLNDYSEAVDFRVRNVEKKRKK